MEGTVSSDEISVPAHSTKNLSSATKGLKNTFSYLGAKCKDWNKKGKKNLFTRNPPEKKETEIKKSRNCTILNKNELVRNAEKEEERKRETKTKQIDIENTEKKKEKQAVQLATNTPASSKARS